MTGNIRPHAAPRTHPQKTDKAHGRFVDILSWENTPNVSGGGGDLLMTEAGRDTSEGFRGPATALIRSPTPMFLYSDITGYSLLNDFDQPSTRFPHSNRSNEVRAIFLVQKTRTLNKFPLPACGFIPRINSRIDFI